MSNPTNAPDTQHKTPLEEGEMTASITDRALNTTGNTDQLQKPEDVGIDEIAREQWLASRREAGLKIDPQTAEVDWIYARVVDPYGVYPELPEEYSCVGREYFARSPGSDIWVSFGDLPEATQYALSKYVRPAFSVGAPMQTGSDGGELDEAALDARIAALMPKTD